MEELYKDPIYIKYHEQILKATEVALDKVDPKMQAMVKFLPKETVEHFAIFAANCQVELLKSLGYQAY